MTTRISSSDMGIRLRNQRSRPFDLTKNTRHVSEERSRGSSRTNQQPQPIAFIHFLNYLVFMILVYILMLYWERSLPTPLYIHDEANGAKNRFIAERARNLLMNLTSVGPRPTGSYENEVLTVNFFTYEINKVIARMNKIHRVESDYQRVSGAFPLTFLDGMTNVYRDVQNIIVKIGPQRESEHSLLINCHYDSVMDSPGASDDGASCAIMLEIFRVLSERETPLRNNVIFLFNGAEENFMQASHGFITTHKWAKSIKAFVNLEACGAGGREILFQAGPENPWLVQAYADSVPYPMASSLAQEVFQSGLIPGDTDYRIFRDFGKLAGLDFAWSSNGYVYHTRLDNIHQIPLGSLQRTGDNILALVQKIVDSDPLTNADNYTRGNLVFFDFFGLFVIAASEMVARILNSLIITMTFFTIWWNIREYKSKGYRFRVYLRGILWSAGAILGSWFMTVITVAMFAQAFASVNRGLSWYARPAWMFFLYVLPTFIVPVCVVTRVSKKFSVVIGDPTVMYNIVNDGVLLIFTVISATLVLLEVRSGFIVSIWLLCSCISWALRRLWFQEWKGFRWLWLHASCLLIPYALSCYVIHSALLVIVPVMGRSGSGNHGEIVLACIVSTMFALIFTFYVPITILVRNNKHILRILSTVFWASVLVLLFTPLGFPYSDNPLSPAPQRYIISHTDRVFHDIYGNVREKKSGLWLADLDINSPGAITRLVPNISRAELVEKDCREELFCGMPYLIPVRSFIWSTHWIPTSPPQLPYPISLNMTYRDKRDNNIQRLSFSVNGPDHMTLVFWGYPGATLKNWSFVTSEPLAGVYWKGRPSYYVFYSYGSERKSWNFWIEIETDESYQESLPLVEVSFGSHFVHGDTQVTPLLAKFLSYFPPWTVTSAWTSTLYTYTF